MKVKTNMTSSSNDDEIKCAINIMQQSGDNNTNDNPDLMPQSLSLHLMLQQQEMSSFLDDYIDASIDELPHRNTKYSKNSIENKEQSTMNRDPSDGDCIPSTPKPPRQSKQVFRMESPVQNSFPEEPDNFRFQEFSTMSPSSNYSSERNPSTPPLARHLGFDGEGNIPIDSNKEIHPMTQNPYYGSLRMIRKPSVSRLRSFSLGSPLPKMPQLLPRLRQRIQYIRLVPRQQQRLLIRANNPIKILWDVLTVVISLTNAYATHVAIGNRSIGQWHGWEKFCQIWFVIDILLNFVTEHQLSSDEDRVLTNCQAVWARYLTSWFVVDLLSLVPGEALFVKPIIDEQKKRGFIKKQVLRVQNITRFVFNVVTRRQIRPKHVTMFSTLVKHSKRAGIGGPRRLIYLMIKYIPKYILFVRKMKGLVALRVLRQFHWFQKLWKNLRNFIFRKSTTVVVDDTNFTTMPLLHKQTLIDDDTLSLTCDSAEFDDDFNMDDTTGDVGDDAIVLGRNVKISSNAGTPSLRKRNTRNQVLLMGQRESGTWEIVGESNNVNQLEQIDEDDFNGGYPY
jgi:hypothetical protein